MYLDNFARLTRSIDHGYYSLYAIATECMYVVF